MAITASIAPEAIAFIAILKAAAPEPQAASTFTASIFFNPTQSAINAPKFSCWDMIPDIILPTYKPSTESLLASFKAARTASPAISLIDFSQCSPTGV